MCENRSNKCDYVCKWFKLSIKECINIISE